MRVPSFSGIGYLFLMHLAVLRSGPAGALERALGASCLPCEAPIDTGVDALVLLAHPVDEAGVRQLAARGAPLLGLGDGFAALCALGLLEGVVGVTQSMCECEYVRVEGQPTPATAHVAAASILRVSPCALVYAHDRPAELDARDLVLLRWCDEAGGVATPAAAIAGVCNDDAHVVGLLPRFDLAYEDAAHRAGQRFFDSLRAYLEAHR